MKYQHRFEVNATLDDVRTFHNSSNSLQAITPPFFFMSNLQAPDRLVDGDEMSFTLWLGPIPVRWEARVENFTPSGFDDTQLSGPFQTWTHAHRFESLGPTNTAILDEVTYTIRPHLIWGPLGILMAIGLPVLFFFRSRRTKAILEGDDPAHRAG